MMENRQYQTLEEMMALQKPVCPEAKELWEAECADAVCKWVVLDDDPTGTQTVHGISVYTDWSEDSIRQGFAEENSMFFILTNSRAMTQDETVELHAQIAETAARVAAETETVFQIISRGDSTLRGNYPAETETLKNVLEKTSGEVIDGEVICPFFPQGGRYTVNNIHYVCMNGEMVPAGETEFAKDKTFGYTSSNLGDWVEEKTGGRYPASEQTYIGLEDLRAGDLDKITRQLMAVTGFGKILVNAMAYEDIYVFAAALLRAQKQGKRFMFRTAAVIPEVLGNITKQGLLEKSDLVDACNPNGGIILVGSHVKKTTDQLNELLKETEIHPIPFRSSLVLQGDAFEAEKERVQKEIDVLLTMGKHVVVYTERTLLVPDSQNPEEALRLSVKISDALTGFVTRLAVKPSFIVAKGGITSSDVGVKGLQVKRATVAGQILPGIPVWRTGAESRFPGIAYVIFPGNVGDVDSLRKAYRKLTAETRA